jgi:hypothetical protein
MAGSGRAFPAPTEDIQEQEIGMDLRLYYQKIRDIEATIADEFPVVVSRETGDGGKSGTLTEVPRRIAAKMIVEGQARLAALEQKQIFRESQAEAKRLLDQVEAAARIQVTVVSAAELDRFKGGKSSATK